jgi:hypothetical protein
MSAPVSKLGHAKSRPWHKRWHGNALNGYRALSLEERGAYTTLLDTMYDQGGPVADQKWNLANILGTDPRVVARIRSRLIAAGKLVAVSFGGSDWLVNDRVQKELGLPTSGVLTADLGRTLPIATADVMDSAPEKLKGNNKPTRASTAKTPPKKKRIEDRTPTPCGFGVSEAVEFWNEAASRSSLPRCAGLSDKRKAAITARLSDHGEEGWRKAVVAVELSRFCNGENDRRWKASIDYLASPSGFLKAIEGQWTADRQPVAASVVVDMDDVWRERIARFAESGRRFWRSADWGPRPGDEGCRVPPSVLDGRRAAA